jgi:hypothetical protein
VIFSAASEPVCSNILRRKQMEGFAPAKPSAFFQTARGSLHRRYGQAPLHAAIIHSLRFFEMILFRKAAYKYFIAIFLPIIWLCRCSSHHRPNALFRNYL